MTNLIVIVNGYPQSGKDTATRFLMDAMTARRWHSIHFSIIDPVRDFLTSIGVDTHAKTLGQRKLLADMMDRIEAHDHTLSRHLMARIADAAQESIIRYVAFAHVRQIESICWIQENAPAGTMVKTLIVKRSGTGMETSNAADANVWDMAYQIVIGNDGSLEDLRATCNIIATFMDREGRAAQ